MAFAPSKRRRLTTIEPAKVSLNAMLDIMTIILLFLLKTYSATGALIHPSIDNLPFSTSEKEARKTLSLILTSDGLFEDIASEEGDKGPLIVSAKDLSDNERVVLPNLEKFLHDRRQLEIALEKAIPSREITISLKPD